MPIEHCKRFKNNWQRFQQKVCLNYILWIHLFSYSKQAGQLWPVVNHLLGCSCRTIFHSKWMSCINNDRLKIEAETVLSILLKAFIAFMKVYQSFCSILSGECLFLNIYYIYFLTFNSWRSYHMNSLIRQSANTILEHTKIICCFCLPWIFIFDHILRFCLFLLLSWPTFNMCWLIPTYLNQRQNQSLSVFLEFYWNFWIHDWMNYAAALDYHLVKCWQSLTLKQKKMTSNVCLNL